MNLTNYLTNGCFETFIPGHSSKIELNQANVEFDNFLKGKGSNYFIFISYNDLSKLGPITSPDEESIYLDNQQKKNMQLMMDVGEQGWLYYMGGFRPNNNWGGLGGIFALDVDEEIIQDFVSKAGHNWFVKGAIGQPAALKEWS